MNEDSVDEEDLGIQITEEGGVYVPPETIKDLHMIDTEDGSTRLRMVLSEPCFVVSYECAKCGYVWVPRSPNPKVCGECKNPNWRG